jgi:hypothetical protein
MAHCDMRVPSSCHSPSLRLFLYQQMRRTGNVEWPHGAGCDFLLANARAIHYSASLDSSDVPIGPENFLPRKDIVCGMELQ